MNIFAFSNEETTYVTYTVRVKEALDAVLFRIRGSDVWIPKSQIRTEDKSKKQLAITTFIAKKKNLA